MPRFASLPLQELAKEPFGRKGVAISLNQENDHVPVLVDSPPEIMALTPDLHEDLIQMPRFAFVRSPTAHSQSS
jgi:hypothetical protein